MCFLQQESFRSKEDYMCFLHQELFIYVSCSKSYLETRKIICVSCSKIYSKARENIFVSCRKSYLESSISQTDKLILARLPSPESNVAYHYVDRKVFNEII